MLFISSHWGHSGLAKNGEFRGSEMESVSSTLCARCQAELVVTQGEQRLPPLANEKLSSSYIPSDTDVAQILSILESKHCQQNIDRYNFEIERLSDILAVLEAQRDNLQHDMDRYKAVVSPVRRLPVEILTEIVSICCCNSESDAYGLEISLEGVLTPTLTLSQTCSAWRSIVTSSPKSWSKLSVNLACVERGMANLVELYLRFSRGTILNLEIFAHDTFYEEMNPIAHYTQALNSDGWTVFLSLLQDHTRWHNVRFDCPLSILSSQHIQEYVDNPTNWVSGHFDALQYLTLVCDGIAYVEPIESNHFFRMLCEKNIPLLNHLDLELFDHDIQFSRIQKLTVHRVVYDLDFFDIFNRCTRVKEVILFTSGIDELFEEVGHQQIITHVELQSLQIEAIGSHASDAVLLPFSFLTLPALTALDLANSVGSASLYSSKSHFTDMLARSSCALQELKLSGDLFASDGDLIDVLKLTPTVTLFSLDAHTQYTKYLTPNFFHALTSGNVSLSFSNYAGSTLLPVMKTCTFAFKQEEPDIDSFLDTSPIMSMLASRRQLASFEFSAQLLSNPDSRRWAKSFQLALSVFTGGKIRLRTNINLLDY
ncbi:hypothetical protein VKT23_000554 [Stygiomarasmius scandens]|uniref:F-box domain-containing protein n=1 Tax=Marasmiellus scandens TaxID=2682957 RepID=A0ABR1K4T7_9AGAR